VSKRNYNMAAVSLGKTMIAMCAGVTTVCVGTVGVNVLENSADAPQFGLCFSGESRFDQSTFMGRYKQMFLACDPLLLLRSDDSLRECAAELAAVKKEYEQNPDLKRSPEENERLWRVKRVVDSAMPNPESGDIIPAPFRMSGYVPFNGPLSVAMVASTSTAGLLLWAWANQSQNALINYFNRNADSEMSNETLAKSYGTAVASALTVGFVLSTVIKRRNSPEKGETMFLITS
jgi:sideroflexin-5